MATYYWVGGSGTWDTVSTTNWAASSGGAGGAGVPNSADTAILDAASSTVTVTLGENVTCAILTCTGFTGTLAFGANKISLTGVGVLFSQSTTMSVTGTPVIDLTNSSSTNRTLNISNVTEANAISYNVTAGTGTFAITNIAGVKNLNFTGFAGTWNNNSANIFGNLTISTGMTAAAGTSARIFAATSGTQQITTNGKTLDFPTQQNSPGATLQLQDNLTMGSTRTFTLTAGTLDLNNQTLSAGAFSSSNSNVRSIAFGTGNITLTGNAGTIWSVATLTNFSFTGTSKVVSNYSGSTGTRTFSHGTGATGTETNAVSFEITAGSDTVTLNSTFFAKNLNFTGFSGTLNASARNIYGNLIFSVGMNVASGTTTTVFAATSGTQQITTAGLALDFPLTFNGIGGTFAFQDALTQGSTRNFTITNGTVQLKNGVTSTVGNFLTSGTNQKFLQSTTPGSQATLAQASGTVTAQYLTIRDINATGGATWNAFVDQGNIDAGNNDGWDFGISPIVGGNEYTYQLRSFTQPRRF